MQVEHDTCEALFSSYDVICSPESTIAGVLVLSENKIVHSRLLSNLKVRSDLQDSQQKKIDLLSHRALSSSCCKQARPTGYDLLWLMVDVDTPISLSGNVLTYFSYMYMYILLTVE